MKPCGTYLLSSVERVRHWTTDLTSPFLLLTSCSPKLSVKTILGETENRVGNWTLSQRSNHFDPINRDVLDGVY